MIAITYVSNPVPDSSLCRAATAPRLHPLQLLRSCSPRNCNDPLQLLLAACIRFSCCSPLACDSAVALDCVHFNCSPIASTLAAAHRLRPLQLLLPITSNSTAAPDCVRFNCCYPPGVLEAIPNVLKHSSQSSRFSKLKYEGRASLV